MKILSNRIRGLRAETGITQEDAARKIGMSLRGYGKIEKDEVEPKIETIVQIANLYDVSIDYLTGRTENRHVN